MGLISRLFRFGFLTPEQGAQTSIYLATSPKVEGVTGKYFVKCKPIASSPASYDEATARPFVALERGANEYLRVTA